MRSSSLFALLALSSSVAVAQQQPQNPTSRGGALTLEEAIAIAQQNNTQYLTIKNTVRSADANLKQTNGSLLPTLSANARTNYTAGGQQVQFDRTVQTNATYNNAYGANLNYQVNAGVLYAPRAARANRAAAQADVTNAAELLRANVTQQYITALQQQATAAVLDTLVTVSQSNLDLVNAKMEAGAGTIIDVRTAEVALGQARVNALTSHNQARVSKLQLFQTMGVPADIDADLTTTFAIAAPNFSLDSVLSLARRVNPDVAARKSRLTAATANVKLARTAYLPTLQVQTGYNATSLAYTNSDILAQQKAASVFGNFQNCMFLDSLRAGAGLPRENCGTGIATADQLAAARASNNPFSFNRVPLNVFVGLSVPIFNGFAREANIEQNKVLRDNAENDVRARNLQLTTDVTQAYLTLVTQAQTVELQTQTAAKAAEDLALQEESFKVGARTFLDVSTARATYEQAQINRVNAIYEYHKAFAALENAIGRPLR